MSIDRPRGSQEKYTHSEALVYVRALEQQMLQSGGVTDEIKEIAPILKGLEDKTIDPTIAVEKANDIDKKRQERYGVLED